MKPIVIAGNGPSLAQIDYTLLPQDFDVFRCNQFYFEDKYFLGKKIKGVFFNPFVLKEQFFTLHHLKAREEYIIEDVYCNIMMGIWDRETWDGKPQNLEQTLSYDFPSVKSTYPFLKQMQEFDSLLKFNALYYNKRFTSGIIMLITALAQGYKEIYLTGIDFYQESGTSYAFDCKDKPNITKRLPQFNQEDFKDLVHTKDIDEEALKLAMQLPNINLYALTPNSMLSQILPLAPLQNPHPIQIKSKPKGYICDFVQLPSLKQENTTPPPSRN